MQNQPHLRYKARWDEALKDGAAPRYLRSVVRMPFEEFRTEVRDASAGFVDRFVASVAAGDLWIGEGALSAATVAEIKQRTLAFRAAQPQSNPKRVEGLPNYHQIQDGSNAPAGGYVAIDNSSYFFRWNGDSHGLFAMVDDVWELGKIVSGRAPDEFVANTPKDLYMDRIQVMQYPAGTGQISTHDDPFVTMKVNVGLYLSTRGIDFQSGGFYIARGPGQKVLLDPQINAGDLVLWFPNLVHGVDTIDAGDAIDWSSPGGRWYMALNTVESDLVKQRHVARAAV